MESSLAWKPERVGPVDVDDIKKNLLGEFSAPPLQESVSYENLHVYLRVRPFTTAENDNAESQDCVSIEGPDTVVLQAPSCSQSNRPSEKCLPQTAQKFSFTQVFGPDASQRTVFEGSVRGLVRNVLEGGNCLVFTYGVTNAGKTFTFLGPEHDSGLLPRSLSVIFNSIEDRLYSRTDLKPQRCRDFSRLTPDQQAAESSSKKNLLRLLKESDRNVTSGRSTFLEGSSLSSDSSVNSVPEADRFHLDVNTNVRFSVWVSFCEIYNDNIHDLLEQLPNGHHKRTVLRLSQDVKGNSFIKDLRWVQVNSSEEAYRVMKIGKKNQSFSSTRLNQLSSRSHSIFSIRILRVDDLGVPRVLGISELALCDLAGSERCSRTHNTGERLREAGNINSSLLTLGKCISAMRLNQHAKIQHHVPFRESKLTHFLQFFFCGAGRVSMVVNINQNASSFDETLNVLKFSALAQKLVVLNSRPVLQDDACQSSATDLSVIIDQADQRRNVSGRGRKSSMVAWETTLEDVLEDEDEEQESAMDGTVLEAGGEEEDTTMEEDDMSDREAALRLVLEAQIREEVCAEFTELFNKMKNDYSEHLQRKKEILEERADKRVEILQNLASKMIHLSSANGEEEEAAQLDQVIISMSADLEKIRQDAQRVQHCLTTDAVPAELELLRLEKQQAHDQLHEAQKNLEHQQQRFSELVEICQQKDERINKLQAATSSAVEDASRDRALVESMRSELLELRQNCRCVKHSGGATGGMVNRQHHVPCEEETGQRVALDDIYRLRQEHDEKEETIQHLMERIRVLEEETKQLAERDQCLSCDRLLSSLEAEQRETSRLTKENKALDNGMFQLQTEVISLQTQLKEQTDRSDSLSEQLQHLQNQSQETTKTIDSLKQELKEREVQSSAFHAALEEKKKEMQSALQSLAQKSQQVQDLQTEQSRLQESLAQSETRCLQLSSQKADVSHQLQSLRTEMERSEEAARREKQELECLREREDNMVLKSNMTSRKKTPQTSGRKRKNWEVEDLVFNENKRNKGTAQNKQSSSAVKENRGEAFEKIQELIHGSSSDLGSKATNIGLITGHLVEETVSTATKPRRGWKKLYRTDASSLMLDSPHMVSGEDCEEKESDHLTAKRHLRPRTCRK